MKTSRCNTKFSVILFIVGLLSTILVYSGDQLNISQNVNGWDKFTIYTNNFMQFLKKNADYIAVTIIPIIVTLKYFSGLTLESRHAYARNLINSHEGSNFLWKLSPWNIPLNIAYLVERLSDEQLKKFIIIEALVVAGVTGFGCYCIYKGVELPRLMLLYVS